MKHSLYAFAVLCVSLLCMSGTALAADSKNIAISGSSTLAPLASELGKRFEAATPGVRVEVQSGGSSRGIADVQRGLVDIGMSSRALHAEEKMNILTHTIAMDGVAFVVHKDNPVSNLSKEDLHAIYTKQKTSWSDFGGPDEQIVVIDRARGRSEVELVAKYLELRKRELKGDVIAGENQQCVKIISGNRFAIVYLSIGTAAFMIEQGTPLKALALEGVSATTENVALGTFPIVRPLLLVTKSGSSALRDSFVSFASSAQINSLIREHAFVPVH